METVDKRASSADDDTSGSYYSTRSLCPVCYELVPGRIFKRDGGVFVHRSCKEHGDFEALTCSDVAWYESLPRYMTEGVRPKAPQTEVALGCPDDCGLCGNHRQIAGTAAIEISNHCNASCPACLAQNEGSFELSVDDVEQAVEKVLQNQDALGVVTLSGGEPTIHPQIEEMLTRLDRPEIERIALNSNGLRIAEDDAFVARLAEQQKIYVCLHYDGDNAIGLRGIEHAVQKRALDRLRDAGVDVVPLVLAAQGVNDHTLGEVVLRLLTDYENVKSVHLSMMTYTGQGGAGFPGDPLTRLTIPGALDRLEESSGGALRKRDFMPLTMPNPMCAAIGYFLTMDGELTPLIPLADRDRVIEATKTGLFGTVNADFEALLRDTIDDIYANPERHPDAPKLLSKFKRLVEAVFPPGGCDRATQLRAAERYIKSVYLFQFMDAWTFDTRRLSKCSCQHVMPDGKIISSCGYYTYHRRQDPRFSFAS